MSLLLLQPNRVVAAPPIGDPLLQFLPDGMTLWSDNRFTQPLAGTTTVNGWYHSNTAPNIERIEDPSAVYGPWVTRWTWAEGEVSNGNGKGTFWTHPTVLNYREYHWAARHRFSANYRTHTQSQTEKFLYPTWTPNPPVQAPLVQVFGTGSTRVAPFGFLVYHYPVDNTSQTLTVVEPMVPAGEWFDIAIWQRIGAPGVADTAIRIWINGTLAGEQMNYIAYRGPSQIVVDKMRYDTTRGGGPDGLPVPAGGMFREIDRMVLHGKTT